MSKWSGISRPSFGAPTCLSNEPSTFHPYGTGRRDNHDIQRARVRLESPLVAVTTPRGLIEVLSAIQPSCAVPAGAPFHELVESGRIRLKLQPWEGTSMRWNRFITTIAASAGVVALFLPPALAAETGTRTEHDLLGAKEVPADAYYGVQTARALENFQISGVSMNHYPGFVEAWAIVKLAAARANTAIGAMKPETLGGDRKGVPGRDRRQVPRPVRRRLVPGRRRNLDQHERQRGAREHRARDCRATRRASTSSSTRTMI